MKFGVTITMIVLSTLFFTQTPFAASNAELEERITALEQQSGTSQERGPLGRISDVITLSGAIELDYSYVDDDDTSDRTSNDSTSDLDVGTVEIGIEAALHDYITATAILKGENLDSDNNVFWDEAFFEIKKEDFPLYLVAGKRVQPFGVFESLLINDPLTCELYEINDAGLTLGAAFEQVMGLDLSATVYRGETLVTKIEEPGYGWTRSASPGFTANTNNDDVESFILSGTIEPFEGISLSAFYNTEPGDTDRNNTAGGAIHVEFAGLILDGEYITALQRELHWADQQEYKEKAWTVSLGYQVIDPLLVAVRYESFDAGQTAAENLENRYSIGATYTLLENDSFACSIMGEYRRTEYETTAGSTNDDELDEFFARIAIEF